MRVALLVVISFALIVSAPSELHTQRRCTKGIPCGNSCIAANKTCRIGAPPARPVPIEPVRAAPTPPPKPASTEPAVNAASTALGGAAAAQVQGALAVPGVPGYVALDSIELLEVQSARLRALERARAAGQGGVPGALPAHQAGASLSEERATAQRAGAGNGPWVASRRGAVYYRAGCRGANSLAVQNRIYFQTEQEAQAAGYRRSTASGC